MEREQQPQPDRIAQVTGTKKPTRLAHALRYAELGYRVFALNPGSKVPFKGSAGSLEASDDPAKIEAMFAGAEARRYNIGIATDGLVVVDVDEAVWPGGEREREMDISSAPMTKTPRKGDGWHYWFRAPRGFSARNSTGKIAKGVDVRAAGGYVVVPPSRVQAGKYSWARMPCHVDELPEPPDWLLADLHRAAAPRPDHVREPGVAVSRVSEPVGAVFAEGGRNSGLASIAGKLRATGLSEEEVHAALRVANSSRCIPPLPDHEVAAVARSVSRYAPDDDAASEASLAPRRGDIDPMPPMVFSGAGCVQEFARWCLAGAKMPQPEAALAAGLCLMSVVMGRRFYDGRTPLNLYCVVTGEAGSGKSAPQKALRRAIQAMGECDHYIGPEEIASGPGITAALTEFPSRVFILDELGALLRSVTKKGAADYKAAIAGVFLRFFDKGNELYTGAAYADSERTKTILAPHLVLFGSTTPSTLYSALNREALEGGLLSRCLVFELADNDPRPRMSTEMDPSPPPDRLVEALRVLDGCPSFDSGNHQSIGWDPAAEAASQALEIETWNMRRAKGGRGGGDEVAHRVHYVRRCEQTRRLACLFAGSRWAWGVAGKETRDILPVVSTEDFDTASGLVAWCSDGIKLRASQYISDTEEEGLKKRIERVLQHAGDRGLSTRELTRQTQGIDRRKRADVLADLVEARLVTKRVEGGKTVYALF